MDESSLPVADGNRFCQDQIERIIKEVDTNGDGFLAQQALLSFFLKTNACSCGCIFLVAAYG